jgi:hypothetical protein
MKGWTEGGLRCVRVGVANLLGARATLFGNSIQRAFFAPEVKISKF